jgi:hypothetical protein
MPVKDKQWFENFPALFAPVIESNFVPDYLVQKSNLKVHNGNIFIVSRNS